MNLDIILDNLYDMHVLQQGDVITSKKIKEPTFLSKLMSSKDVVFVYKMKTKTDKKNGLAILEKHGFTSFSYRYKKDQLLFASKSEDRIDHIKTSLIDMMMLAEPEECENIDREITKKVMTV